MSTSQTIPRWAERGRIIPLYTEAGPVNVLKGCLSNWPWITKSPEQVHRWCNYYSSEETVRRLKNDSVNFIMAGWSVGFSTEAERIQRELVSGFIKRCHASGIRVGTYLSWSNLFWESMFEDVPASKTWCRLDPAGEPFRAFGRETRYMACVNKKGWWDHLKERVSSALETDTDMIFFDNMRVWCYCRECQALFRKHTKRILGKAYGLPTDPDAPSYGRYLVSKERILRRHRNGERARISLALLSFHEERLTTRLRAMRAHIKSQRPDVLLAGNIQERVTTNRLSDVFVTETPTFPGVEGRQMVTNAPLYKHLFTTGQGKKSFIALQGQRRAEAGRDQLVQKLAIAEGAAFGAQCGCHQMHEFTHRDYNRFLLTNQECYTRTYPVTKVAVIGEDDFTHCSYVIGQHRGFVDQLAQQSIMFDVLLQRDLRPSLLKKYALLVLHNSMVMDDHTVEVIRRFVRAGGNLLSCGSPALIRPDYTRRDGYALSDVFGAGVRSARRTKGKVKNPYGRGHSVFYPHDIARIGPGDPAKPARKIPREFIRDLRRLAGGACVEVTGPEHVVAHLMKKERGDRIMVHLLNYSCKRVRDVRIRLRAGGDLKGRVKILSPDKVSRRAVRVVRCNDGIGFSVPEILVYCLALVD